MTNEILGRCPDCGKILREKDISNQLFLWLRCPECRGIYNLTELLPIIDPRD